MIRHVKKQEIQAIIKRKTIEIDFHVAQILD